MKIVNQSETKPTERKVSQIILMRQNGPAAPDEAEHVSDTQNASATQALPSFVKMSSSDFKWGAVDDTAVFVANIHEAYKKKLYTGDKTCLCYQVAGKHRRSFVNWQKCFGLMVKALPLKGLR